MDEETAVSLSVGQCRQGQQLSSSAHAVTHRLRHPDYEHATAGLPLEQPTQLARVEPGSSIISGRYAVLAGIRPGRDAADVAYQQGELYDSVILGASSRPVERNSVLLIPQLLTPEECSALIEDAEQKHAAAHSRQACEKKRRLWVRELSPSSGELVDKVLSKRLLPFISKHLPTVEDYVWARSESVPVDACSNLAPLRTRKREPETTLSSLQYRFSPREPAVNRYTAGGCFETHIDKHALTVNVLLHDGGMNGDAFDGGGTAFFREDEDNTQKLRREARLRRRPYTFASTVEGAPTVVIHPKAGVGVVFSGEIKHAGRAVTAGLRHVLVASFSIADEAVAQLVHTSIQKTC